MKLDLLGLQLNTPLAHPGAINFRPPIWPPPPNWPPVVDARGNPQCMYADSTWSLDVWAGTPLKINFGDGFIPRGARISPPNAELLRRCAVWLLWGTRGCRAASTFAAKIGTIKPLFAVCTQHGIIATDLMRFEILIDQVAASLAPSCFGDAISILHELLDAREHLGFCLLDQFGLARLAKLTPKHERQQTPYIPSRIWSYQLARVRECLEDYNKHCSQIDKCFTFCLDAYAENFGSLKIAINSKSIASSTPFQNKKFRGRFTYHGSFKLTADRFGITELIEKWVGKFTNEKGEMQIAKLSQYLDVVSIAGLAYIMNFSLMRVEEAWNLRSDCLLVEQDASFGEIHMLRGETTKTEADADARWPVSNSVSLAITVMRHIAELRMRCARERDNVGITPYDVSNPYLISYQYEPWSNGKHKSYRLRPVIRSYDESLHQYAKLIEINQIVINKEDLRIARLMTPNLDIDVFKVGSPWRFGWHQLRRTGAVNMLSSDMVDESSLQLLLKHQSRVMTLYYGRNYARLALSEESRTLFLKTMYQEMGRDLRKLTTSQFISPLGEDRKESIVTLIKEADALSLEKAARQGQVVARRIRAGFCVNHRPCPYGGIEAIAHCLGADSGKGCPDLLIDTGRGFDINLYAKVVDGQLKDVHPDSPRYRRLQAEKQATGIFHEIVQSQER